MNALRIASIALVAVLLIAGGAMAGDNFTWTGNGANDNWNTTGNWSGGPGPTDYYPKDADDTATVPDALGDPIVNLNIALASLTVHDGNDPAVITIQDGTSSYRTLTIYDEGGLSVGEGATIGIQYDAKLVILAGGTVTLDGNIVFTDDSGSRFADGVLHIEETTILAGSGDITTETATVNGVISAADAETVLVLGSGHDISGKFDIHAPLVNNGRILADFSGEVILLSTYAKSGNGVYEVSASGASIIVEIPVNGSPRASGYQLIVSNGTFQVNEFCVLCGELNMTGGTIDIDTDAMFEISGCD